MPCGVYRIQHTTIRRIEVGFNLVLTGYFKITAFINLKLKSLASELVGANILTAKSKNSENEK